MRLLLIAAAALASLVAASPAAAGDPETCAYRELHLAQACRNNPEVRRFLLEPENAGVERYIDVPPIVRGWLPGEQAALDRGIADLQRSQASACDYPRAPMLVEACLRDPQVRAYLADANPGPGAIWFNLPPEIGGYPGSRFNEALLHRNSGANRQRFEWGNDVNGRDQRAYVFERTLGRALGADVAIARLHLIAVDGVNLVACGYAFSNGGGYEAPSSGTFIFDTRTPGENVYRASPEQFRARCLAADAVLK